jgi:hypothetical protein
MGISHLKVDRNRSMKRFAMLAASVSLVLAVFSPSLRPLLWHLRYGDTIAYEGKRVPVPRYWYPKLEFRSLEISKPPLTVFSLVGPPPVWSFLKPLYGARPNDVEATYRSFETYYRAAVVPGNVVGKPVRIGKGQSEADCMQQSPMIGENIRAFRVSCSRGRGWVSLSDARTRWIIFSKSFAE